MFEFKVVKKIGQQIHEKVLTANTQEKLSKLVGIFSKTGWMSIEKVEELKNQKIKIELLEAQNAELLKQLEEAKAPKQEATTPKK